MVAVTTLAAVFVIPAVFDRAYHFRPWRLGLDLIGGAHLVYQVDLAGVVAADRDSVVNGLRDVIERRVNLFGVSEPQVYIAKSGEQSRLVVELAGAKDVKEAIKEIGAVPFLNFATVDVSDPNNPQFTSTNLNGRYVTGAQMAFDQTTGQPYVTITFNDEGGKIFEALTAANVGKPVAIFLDKDLIEMPTVQEKISGGRAQITGRFTTADARQLVKRFNAGALPAPMTLINQQIIGASLGADSLQKTMWAGLIGAGLVVAFMTLYYWGYGIAASVALAIYVALTLAVYKLFGVTMTLAGIAGFILSIGMAVDANILIFERRKEEVRKGVSKTAALEDGFRRAWPSIRDSNISTILTSIILYYFMTGFVRGFALTLLIGVVMSMFSAIVVTKTLLRVFVKS